MKNPFKFYTGKEHNQDNARATNEIIKEIGIFQEKIQKIINKYRHVGASDTQSREEIVNFIKNRLDEGGFI
jgi:uncharacterized protein YfdQ (DUF2303 family)